METQLSEHSKIWQTKMLHQLFPEEEAFIRRLSTLFLKKFTAPTQNQGQRRASQRKRLMRKNAVRFAWVSFISSHILVTKSPLSLIYTIAVEYEDGESLRVLPCNHYMHKSCVDEWLVNHPSCPSCRHSLSELVDDRPLMQLRTLRSRLSGRSSTMRRFRHYHSAWSEQEIPQVEMGLEFDLHFISTLELIEEGGADITSQQATNEQGLELADMNRRSRTNRLARVRRNLARMRRERAGRNGNRAVPLAESLDEDPDNTIL